MNYFRIQWRHMIHLKLSTVSVTGWFRRKIWNQKTWITVGQVYPDLLLPLVVAKCFASFFAELNFFFCIDRPILSRKSFLCLIAYLSLKMHDFLLLCMLWSL